MAKMISEETTLDVIAYALYDNDTSRTLEEWKEHAQKFKNDPKGFFGSNSKGYEEYMLFTERFDKDRKELNDLKNKKANRR